MTTKKIKQLSQINICNNESYSESKIKLIKLKKLIKGSQNRVIVDGACNKLVNVFVQRNKYIKKDCIPLFRKTHQIFSSIDTVNIIRMLYCNDSDVHRLVLKFIGIFYKFFIDDDVAWYYVINSKDMYKYKVIKKLCRFDYYKSLGCISDEPNEGVSTLGTASTANCHSMLFNECANTQNGESKNRETATVKHKKTKCETHINDEAAKRKKIQYEERIITRPEESSYNILLKGMRYLYNNKRQKANECFTRILALPIDSKYKTIIRCFIKRKQEKTEYKFNIEACFLSASLVCTINGYKQSDFYKMMQRCYNNGRRRKANAL